MQKYLEAGKVVTTHGVRGEMKLELWCDGVDFLKKAGRLYASAKGGKCYNITSIRPQGQMALLQLEGVNDLDAARAESAELQTKLDEANAASSEAADKLSEAETRLSEAEKARETLEKTLESAQKENDTLSRRAQANELLVSAQAALEQGDYAALRSHLEALGAYADALKDDGAALYETLRSYID